MKSILKLIILCSCCLVYCCSAAHVDGIQQIHPKRNTQGAQEEQNVTKLVDPSEIRVPTLEELTTFIENIAQQKHERGEPEAAVKDVTYTELYQLLAKWHLNNQKNFYEMQETTVNFEESDGNAYDVELQQTTME